ncbi:MAG: Ig-like domain-containing protein [Candidatus Micrarchaeota archaeon]
MKKTVFLIGLLVLVMLSGCLGPSAPAEISAEAVKGGIEVTWGASPSASVAGYNVYKSMEKGSLGSKINPAVLTGTKYTDSDVIDGDTYYYAVRAVTTSGSEDGNLNQASATADTTPPDRLTLAINGDGTHANSTSVQLTVSANGATACRFSNDGTTWEGWMEYAGTYNWQLTSGDGMKTVYAECKDKVGNVAGPVSSTITLDTVLPEVTISNPAQGQEYSQNVDVTFTVTDSAATVTCIGYLDGNQFDIGVSETGSTHSVKLHPAEGQHTLYVECSDEANTGKSGSVSFKVTKLLPATVRIESGSGYTDTTSVTLDVSSDGASDCRYSNDNVDWTGWSSYVAQKSWSLTSGDGEKVVYVQCKDSSGTLSVIASDSIVLDTSPPPYISVIINNGDQVTNTRDVVLGLYAFGASRCRFSNEDLQWSPYELYVRSKNWKLTQGDGLKTVHYQCNDRSNNSVGTSIGSITLSQIPPVAPDVRLEINNDDSHTSSRRVTLIIDSLYASKCRLRNSEDDFGDWFTHTGRDISWTLSAGEGRKTVYVECKNDYGTGNDHASIYLDSEKPGTVTDLDGQLQDGAVYLSWSRPDKGSDIKSYSIYRRVNGQSYSLYHSSYQTSYTDRDVKGGLTYDYYIKARDASGNEGAKGNVVTIRIDSSGPSVQITYPKPGGEVASPFAIGFTVVDTQYDSVSCNWAFDGHTAGSDTYPTGSEQTVHTGLTPPDQRESHTLTVTCRDGAGNKGSAGPMQFYLIPSVGPTSGPIGPGGLPPEGE